MVHNGLNRGWRDACGIVPYSLAVIRLHSFFMMLFRLLFFLFLPNAFFAQTTVPMCPCVQTGTTCQRFDRRYQAYSLDEAMRTFTDLSLEEGDGRTADEDETCETEECIGCRKQLEKRLKEVGLVQSQIPTVFDSNVNVTCTKYKFTKPSSGKKSEHNSSSSSEEDDDDDEKDKKHTDKHKKTRHRRQATMNATDPTLIGSRYTISCSPRGSSTDATGKISLCSSCWVWRKLPDNYAPQYVNELICDDTDPACLSGYASCSLGTHSVDVVRNDGGVLTTVALSAGSFCECRANANSALQSLVDGTGLSSAVPPLTSSA